MQPPALGVVLQPAAQARPLAQQRLVGDLDLALADREQAALGERGEDGPRVVAPSSSSGTRRRTTASPSPSPASRSRITPRDPLLVGVEPLRTRPRPAARPHRAHRPTCS